MLNVNPHKILAESLMELEVEPTLAEIKRAADWFGLNTFNDPAVEGLVSAALRWGLRVKRNRPPVWLAMLGKSGIGKTMIAHKLWITQVSNGRTNTAGSKYSPHFVYWPRFVDQLRNPEGDALDRALDMANWPFLFLDDICAERDSTGFSSDKLNTILGSRTGKWTVITSNKHLSQLAAQEVRIADRIQRGGGIVVESTAKSFSQR